MDGYNDWADKGTARAYAKANGKGMWRTEKDNGDREVFVGAAKPTQNSDGTDVDKVVTMLPPPA